MPGTPAQILILTEDSSDDGRRTVGELVRRMLRIAFPKAGWQVDVLDVASRDTNRELPKHAHGPTWKSPKTPGYIQLVKGIATELARKDREGFFVAFHIDGDAAWSDRESVDGNKALFEHRFATAVRDVLARPPATRPRGQTAPPEHPSAEQVARVTRLLRVMPYYSIEAWTYQNIDKALEIIRTRHGGDDAQQFEHWREHRAALDEVLKIKEATCLHDRHNIELATENYPARNVHDAGASFRAVVDLFRACSPLAEALKG